MVSGHDIQKLLAIMANDGGRPGDEAAVTTARNLPGRAQAVKTTMSPPQLIPLITTRSGSAHSVAAEPDASSFGSALEARSVNPKTHVH